MIVGLDGTPLTLSSGGLRRYTEQLVQSLRREFPDDTYHLLSDQLTPPGNLFERRWWTIGLPRTLARLGCDVFHGTDYAVPYLPLKPAVMTVHDVSPWLDPAWHHDASRVRARTPALIRLGLAGMLIVPVQNIRKQVLDLFGLHPDRVSVVPYAAPPGFGRVEPYSERPYFLFVGTIEPRKNVPALVDAWRTLRREYDVDLILAGRRRQDGPRFEPEPGLHVLGEVDDGVLPRLYSGALALVYPSLYEGFGLPVVEAMQCGCPVVTSTDPTLLEVSGDAAIHTADYYGVMRMLLENPEERARRSEMSFRRARDFSWERTARLTREVYAEAIRQWSL